MLGGRSLTLANKDRIASVALGKAIGGYIVAQGFC